MQASLESCTCTARRPPKLSLARRARRTMPGCISHDLRPTPIGAFGCAADSAGKPLSGTRIEHGTAQNGRRTARISYVMLGSCSLNPADGREEITGRRKVRLSHICIGPCWRSQPWPVLHSSYKALSESEVHLGQNSIRECLRRVKRSLVRPAELSDVDNPGFSISQLRQRSRAAERPVVEAGRSRQ